MIKIETHPNGYTSITGCSNCDDAPYLWFNKGEWVIDSDDGLRGYPAKYCPACGTHLTLHAADAPPPGAWLRKKNGERIPLEVVYRAEETDNA